MIHSRIRLAIIEKFYSQANFAAAAGEHAPVVSQIVRGRHKLTPEKASQWVDLLGCDPEILKPIVKENSNAE